MLKQLKADWNKLTRLEKALCLVSVGCAIVAIIAVMAGMPAL